MTTHATAHCPETTRPARCGFEWLARAVLPFVWAYTLGAEALLYFVGFAVVHFVDKAHSEGSAENICLAGEIVLAFLLVMSGMVLQLRVVYAVLFFSLWVYDWVGCIMGVITVVGPPCGGVIMLLEVARMDGGDGNFIIFCHALVAIYLITAFVLSGKCLMGVLSEGTGYAGRGRLECTRAPPRLCNEMMVVAPRPTE